jgi:hypothetical protein
MTEELTRPTEKELQTEIQASLLNTLELLSKHRFEPKPPKTKFSLETTFSRNGENVQYSENILYGCFNTKTKTL